MSHTSPKVIATATPRLFGLLFLTLLVAFLSAKVAAQTAPASGSSDAITPIGMKPGAPAGSYALSGFDNINYFSGLMNFHLPLLSVGGRGSAGYTMMLSIQQTWQVRHARAPSGCGQGGCTGPTIHTYIPDPNPWEIIQPGYSPGVMVMREAGNNFTNVGGCIWYSETLTRMTFIGPDGTEYDFRDQLYNGQPRPNGCNGSISRGRVFKTSDGSGVTFISDTAISEPSWFTTSQFYPTGYMLLKNGTRYRISAGAVQWIQDRQGNRVSFSSANGVYTITDSLGRQVTIESGVTDPTYGSCDRIHFNGAGGVARTIYVRYDNLGNALRTGYSLQTFAQLFPSLNGASTTGQFNYSVVSAVVLPDGRQYQFKYNSYRELARVLLPTGGAYEYDYAVGSGVYTTGLGSDNAEEYGVNRRVIERRVYVDGSNLEGKTTFTRSAPATIVDSLSPVGTLLAREKHYFYGDPLTPQGTPTSYSTWKQGKEYMTELYNVVSGTATLKKSITNTFMQRAQLSWWTGSQDNSPANDPRQVETSMTLADTNQVSKTTSINPANGSVGYDQYNNPTDTWDYDFGTGAPATYPMRHTHTDYLTYNSANGLSYDTVNPNTSSPDPTATIHIRGLAVAQQVYSVNPANGAETVVAQSTTAYDESSYSVLTYSSVTGWSAPGTAGLGNATTTSRWLNTNNTWLSTHAQYDQLGNVRYSWDAKGNQTQVTYNDSYSDNINHNTFALPTTAITPVPDPTGVHGSATAFTTTAKYDYSTGLIVSQTDGNGQVSTLAYNDALDRTTQMVRVVGTTKQIQTTVAYDDVNHVITTTTDKDNFNDNLLKSQTVYDGLGRTTEKRAYESAMGYITIAQQYDAMGRLYRTSNPYRNGGTVNWTTTAFDSLNRVLSVTTPDAAQTVTAYNGNQTTAADQAGKQRSSLTDSLGRLTQIIEAPNDSNYNYQTTYSYDALGNLSSVTQGVQHRYFMYDSLSRLIRARNPEQDVNTSLVLSDPVSGNSQWSLAYSYDNNGNLSSRTDARTTGSTATYAYDNLNRNTAVSYSDGSHIDRVYDLSANGHGRIYYSVYYPTSGAYSLTAVDSYDVLGRPLYQRQHFYSNGSWGTAFVTQRDYDLAGHVKSQTYPSGKGVNYTYDLAGRANSFTGNLGDGVTRTYAGSISYDEWNGLSREQFGTDLSLYHKEHRNIRGQLYDMRLSTVNDDLNWNRGAVVNYYNFQNFGFGTSGTDNNGNLLVQQTYVPVDDAISSYSFMQQNYGYDSLNRLTSVGEFQNGATQTGAQNYSYDRYGNRTISSWSGTGISGQYFALDANNTNRLTVPSGQYGTMQYDQNGNLTYDNYSGNGNRAFDAENRMVTATNSGGQTSTYTYDSDNHRVRRNSFNQEIWQVYGIGGELVAEYAANTSPASPQREFGYRNGQLLVSASGSSCGVGYQGTKAWGAINAPIYHQAGHQEGSDWVGTAGTDAAGVLSYGPYDNTFGQGHHMAKFLLQVNSIAGSDVVATLDVVTNLGGTVLAQRQVKRNEFTAANQWQWFTLEFDNPCFGLVEARINWGGAVSLRFNQLTITGVNSTGSTIQWIVTDQLGTPRMIADKTGYLTGISRHDYLPFGEELYAGSGGRTAAQGYGDDNVRQQFTGYERDNETGLDFAQARYYSSPQGRFTSVDPLPASSSVSNPQSFNRYSYVFNNPMNATDPSGMHRLDAFDQLAEGPYLRMLEDMEERFQEMQREQQQVQQQQGPPPPQQQPQQQPTQGERIDEAMGHEPPPPILTATVTATPVDFDVNLPLEGGSQGYFTGFDSVLTITVFSMGKPVASVTGTESVKPTKLCGDQTLRQNTRPVTVNPSFDLVGVGLFSPSPVTDRSLVRRIFQENAFKACTQITEQRMTMNVPGVGPATVNFERTFTNVDANGNLSPFRRSPNGVLINYSISTSKPTVTH